MKDLAEEDRPREKMLRLGVMSLTDAELLAILLRSGSTDSTVVELAQQLLSMANNNLNELGKFDVGRLTKLKGIGPTKAVTVLAALELGRRRNASDILNREKVTSSQIVVQLMQPLLADLPHEEFWALLLNRSNRIIDKVRVSQGGTCGTVVDVKLVMKAAIEKLAVGIIMVHNHPSGNEQPSSADVQITKKLASAAELFSIKLIDHVVITDSKCLSFADEGLL